ncbi:SRPBCC family protein [Sphingobium tyrosinilyticum]|uniref:SRPBCC family protein n=1 Tax=Sphingobium tyrosinilyticum TaxID=2715436 RepID=A0ABV9F1C5_9SPHN
MLDEAEIHLRPVRVETWAGCAFINFDVDAQPLMNSLGPLTEELDARHVEKLRVDWWYASELPVNWKVAVEAFMEMYHLMKTHPQFHALSRTFGGELGDRNGLDPKLGLTAREAVNRSIDLMVNLSEGMGGLVHHSEVRILETLRDMELPDDPHEAIQCFFKRACDAIRDDGLARGLPMFDIAAVLSRYPGQGNELFFPNFFLLPQFSAMASYRIRPTGPESCLFEIWSLVLKPEKDTSPSPNAPTLLPYDSPDYPLIPRQDYSNMPEQQKGLRSGAIIYQRLSEVHEGAISNFERLIDGYLAGLDINRLNRAHHVVNGCSFGPIADLGF